MLKIVTSYTREPVGFDIVHHLSPAVLSVVTRHARRTEDYVMVPYADVLALAKRHGITVEAEGEQYVCRRQDGFVSGKPQPTPAEALLAHYQYRTSQDAKRSPRQSINPVDRRPAQRRAS